MQVELPLTSATALDRTGSRPGLQKYRQHLRGSLFSEGLSLMTGKGRVQLENMAMLSCLETARRWNWSVADRLSSAYREAGLDRLMRSRPYRRTLDLTRQALDAALVEGRLHPAVLVARTMGVLVREHAVVREVTEQMHHIHLTVGRLMPELERHPGRLVRMEGPEALVVVNTGDREELRRVDASYLRDFGIESSGEPFVLQELRWSPDAVASVYLPAVDIEDEPDRRELEKELEAAETPLPTLQPLP